MKNLIVCGRMLLFVWAICFGLTSCKEEKTVDPKEVAIEENEEALQEARDLERIAAIVVDVADFNLMQRELGKLGQAKGISQEVKDLGATIETYHNEAFQEVNEYAKSKGLSVPTAITADGQKEYDRLSKLDENNFDKEFLSHMEKYHKDGIDIFRKDAGRTENVEINALLDRQIIVMERHHNTIEDLLQKKR